MSAIDRLRRDLIPTTNADSLSTWVRSPRMLLVPLLAVLLFMFVGPMLILVLFSVQPTNSLSLNPLVWTVDSYVTFASKIVTGSGVYGTVLRATTTISVLTVVTTFLISFPAAYALARKVRRFKTALLVAMILPLLTSVTIRVLGWVMFLMKDGVLSSVFGTLGLPYDSVLYQQSTIVLGTTYVYLPFMLFPIYLSMLSIPESLYTAASDLGASRGEDIQRHRSPDEYARDRHRVAVRVRPVAGRLGRVRTARGAERRSRWRATSSSRSASRRTSRWAPFRRCRFSLSPAGAACTSFRTSISRISLSAAAAGVVAGGATAVLFACRRTRYGLCSSCGRHADVAAGALAAHRAVEGLALGAAAAVGGAVGVVGAALVAGHAAVEAGLLGHAYGRTSVGWGVVVVAGLQSALAIGGAVGAVTPLHVPPAVETAALAAVGAVLFTTGLDGVRAWLPATGA
ncbi:MAG: hypothetical protein A07HB70_00407 [uncultured archaeon A07HB70]|nr:MAG: hypothetical protein A07HB70_00407 [uncultured archaeon A07HB70]